MKFNTKEATPVASSPEHCFIKPNRYIPSSIIDSPTADSLGRQVHYETTMVFTPVYVPSRGSNNNKKHYISQEGVNELTNMLNSLSFSSSSSSEDEATNDYKPDAIVSYATAKNEDDTSGLGRFFTSFFDGSKKVTVKRSARLNNSN